MTDKARVTDVSPAAAPQTHSDNFDRTELFSSFGQTAREQSSTDTTRNGADSVGTISSDQQFNQTDATDSNSFQTNQNDRQNGEHAKDASLRSDASGDSQSLDVPNVFEELGLTRGLSSRGDAKQPSEGNANNDRSPLKIAEQPLPTIAFFDSASASASISSRIDVALQKNKARDHQPGNLRNQPDNRRGDRIETRPDLESAKPPGGLQVENLGASKEFAARVQKQIGSLTPDARSALEKSGVEIIATDKLTSVRPDLKGQEPYNQSGSTYENLDGFYLPNSKSVVIAESRQDKAGKTVPNDRVEGVFKHEVGHALDASLGNFSQKPEFVEAHKKDTENLNAFDKGMFGYLIGSKDGDGKPETFAEVWGALNGASSDPRETNRILQKFPNVANLIKQELPKFIKK
ncbi:MAG: hypothetical protein SGJ27_17270 [Candidatus Melainabacteria bacterium]|nr:hypothetical protein [Candidatus Melainabacteria bacterium]